MNGTGATLLTAENAPPEKRGLYALFPQPGPTTWRRAGRRGHPAAGDAARAGARSFAIGLYLAVVASISLGCVLALRETRDVMMGDAAPAPATG